MDKLRAITFFTRAAEATSFAAAAQALDVVPSALSKTITALEQALGFALFNRSTRRLSLTAEGEAYYKRCRQLLGELEEAEAAARGGALRPQGTLRVGMHPALRSLLFPALHRLLDSGPTLTIETRITNSPGALLDSGLDVLLRIGRLADSTLVARRLGWAEVIVCASPEYLRRWGEPRHPKDLAQHRAIVYGRADEEPNTQWAFTRGTERHVVAVPVRMIVRDGIGLVDVGAGGGGLLRPYELAARSWLATGGLEVVMSEWSSGRHPLYAVLPSSRHVPAKVRVFLDFAQALLSGEPSAPVHRTKSAC
jgi:LysR family transcriptional regulator, regulator for bpeEF and oprC